MSRTGQFWLGVGLSIPVVVVLVFGALVALATAYDSEGGIIVFWVVVALLGLAVVGGLVWEATRFTTLGVLAGTAVIVIVLGGACAAIIAGLSG